MTLPFVKGKGCLWHHARGWLLSFENDFEVISLKTLQSLFAQSSSRKRSSSFLSELFLADWPQKIFHSISEFFLPNLMGVVAKVFILNCILFNLIKQQSLTFYERCYFGNKANGILLFVLLFLNPLIILYFILIAIECKRWLISILILIKCWDLLSPLYEINISLFLKFHNRHWGFSHKTQPKVKRKSWFQSI